MPVMPTAGRGNALPWRDNAFGLLVPNAACYVNTQAFNLDARWSPLIEINESEENSNTIKFNCIWT